MDGVQHGLTRASATPRARVLDRSPVRYALAVLLPASAILLLTRVIGPHGSQFLFVLTLTVAAAALAGGVGPGLVAAAVSVIGCAVFLLDPLRSLAVADPLEAVRLAVLGTVALVVAGAAGSLRDAYRRAAAERAAALRAAEQLREAQARLARAVDLRDQVLAVVSHDLKSPLANIAMAADLLERRARTSAAPELASHAVPIRRATARAERLIHDLLDVASIEAGQLSVRPRAEDPAALAREAVEAAHLAAEAEGVAVRLEPPGPLPEVDCDRERVLQVLSNLLGNALKATPPGGAVTVSVAPAGERVRFTVADTGCGIPADELPHVFDRFRRGRSAAYPGSGLGLAIVQGIVAAHGGEVSVESRPGEGARFTFVLPGRPVASAGGARGRASPG